MGKILSIIGSSLIFNLAEVSTGLLAKLLKAD